MILFDVGKIHKKKALNTYYFNKSQREKHPVIGVAL